MADNVDKFIGYGMIFPIQLEAGGVPKQATGFELLRSDITILLSWPKFTRWYNYEYGSRIEDLLQEPNDTIVKQVVRRFIIDTIQAYEKRVKLYEVEIEIANRKTLSSKINIRIGYTVVKSQVRDSFVFPFYV